MAMTSIEKKMIVAMAVLVGFSFFFAARTCSEIEKAGGIKAAIIDTGKEIKDISRKIQKD